MVFDFSSVGDVSAWAQGNSEPASKVTDLSAHVDGGQVSTRGAMGSNTVMLKASVVDSALIVLAALVALWVLGAVSFKSFNL